MSNGSWIDAVRNFIESKAKTLADLVHPEVTAAIAAISHEVLTTVEEIEARVAACEAQLRGGQQIPPAPSKPSE